MVSPHKPDRDQVLRRKGARRQYRADAEIDAGAVRQALAGLDGVGVVDLKQSLDALYAHYLGEARWQSLLGGAW